jgi:UDP-N-acetylglucosamine 2-epimerase
MVSYHRRQNFSKSRMTAIWTKKEEIYTIYCVNSKIKSIHDKEIKGYK